ncbi:MAG: SUMF1/EgtB/PvdO family nonheme iron enzyme, partial [Chloroflexota bacterium]
EPIPDVYQINSDVPDEMVDVIRKALAKSPDDRYQTGTEMATALREDVRRALNETTLPTSRRKKKKPREDSGATMLASKESVGDASVKESAQSKAGAQSQGFPTWLMGVGAVVLLLLIGLAALFFFSRSGTDTPEEELVASATLPSSEGMMRIPADSYSVGVPDSSGGEFASEQTVELNQFWLDQYEVTNSQYQTYIDQTDGEPPSGWADGTVPAGKEAHPVEGITWDMAAAYCQSVSKRLPSEAEWEVAARGSEGLLYPWGDDERAVELPRTDTYEVGTISENRSPFGIYDMAGNVWEWVDTPYAAVDSGNRVLRGGAHGFLQNAAYRLQGDPSLPTMSATSGIRCAATEVLDDSEGTEEVAAEDTLLSDDFTNPESGWPSLAEDNQIYGYHPPDFYHVEVSAPGELSVASREPNFEDLTVESDLFVEKTDTEDGDFRYGLVLRRTGDDYYAFTISNRTKTWQVLKSTGGTLEILSEGSNDTISGQDRNSSDTIRVDAQGDRFVFHINDQPVANVQDSAYPTGEVGFYNENFDETLSHIHYDSLTIREVDFTDVQIIPEGVLAFDDFTDPNSGWPSLAEDTEIYGYHPPDFYHVEVSQPNDISVASRDPDFEDVTVESDLFIEKTDTEDGEFRYGLVLRHQGDNYYAFTISSRAKAWYILKGSADGVGILAEGNDDSIQGQNRNSSDTLRVDAQDDTFILHINGQPVAQISDADYATGQIGFYNENFDETLSHIHYDSLTISEVEFEPVPELIVSAPVDEPEATEEPAETPDTSESDVIAIPTEEATEEVVEEATEEASTESSAIDDLTLTTLPAPEGMVFVQPGYFLMGSTQGAPNEAPEHPVFIDAFFIDQFEVKNADYNECVDDGSCSPTSGSDGADNLPATNLSHQDADTYCFWVGKRLPTEAEWEYAASGADNLIWPWGNTFSADLSAASESAAQPVDSYPDGVSPFGAYNMAGNVSEWVGDTFDPDFYETSPASNPFKEGAGDRIHRGGSFGDTDEALYTTSRRVVETQPIKSDSIGFRCADDAFAQFPRDERTLLIENFCAVVYSDYKPGASCP